MTPYRVRRAFRHLRDQLAPQPACRKPPAPAPDARPEARTPQPHATASDQNFAKPTHQRKRAARRRVKSEAWRRSPRARTPSPGRSRDPPGSRPARAVIGTRAACQPEGGSGRPGTGGTSPHPARHRPAPVPHADRAQPRALAPAERAAILDALHSTRFADLAPDEVWATLLDEGTYLGSVSTYYRVLREAGESRERRAQATHPAAVKPELVATGPNQVYSWDITKLHGPAKWTYYHLYVILDIYSRYAVGWMVAARESAILAEKLISETCAKQGISRGQLSIHADRGSSKTSKPVALLLADLGIAQSHSRPHMSNDNPYSEAQFKTLKYCPAFPSRFPSIESARAHCQASTSSPGTTTSITTADSACTPPPTSTTARRQPSGRARPGPERRLPRPPRALRRQATRPAKKLPGTSWMQPAPGEKKAPLTNTRVMGASFRLTDSVAAHASRQLRREKTVSVGVRLVSRHIWDRARVY